MNFGNLGDPPQSVSPDEIVSQVRPFFSQDVASDQSLQSIFGGLANRYQIVKDPSIDIASQADPSGDMKTLVGGTLGISAWTNRAALTDDFTKAFDYLKAQGYRILPKGSSGSAPASATPSIASALTSPFSKITSQISQSLAPTPAQQTRVVQSLAQRRNKKNLAVSRKTGDRGTLLLFGVGAGVLMLAIVAIAAISD